MATEKRMIDANALIDWLARHTGFRGNCEDCTDIDCLDCIIENAVKNAPTVDAVEVVHGRWEPHMEEMEDGFGKFEPVQTGLRCSVCGRYSCCGGNFCKDCGAKMDGGNKDE